MEQTAVDWLVDELTKNGHNFKLYKKEIEKAKQMFEQQIIISHINGKSEFDTQSFDGGNMKRAEQYYNETFKTK